MPYIDVKANVSLEADKTAALKSALAEKLADSFPGKTENWLMLAFRGGEDMYFAGSAEPCAMVDVSIFGPQLKKNYDRMTKAVCALLEETCGIPANRVYVKYTEYDKWGWNGSNF